MELKNVIMTVSNPIANWHYLYKEANEYASIQQAFSKMVHRLTTDLVH